MISPFHPPIHFTLFLSHYRALLDPFLVDFPFAHQLDTFPLVLLYMLH